ncbi:MAG TPA: hypothetical protein VGS41_10920 [Chthonomonadales bacterium]|nr:hypothetical protein [Chthonomonadales bacterium]
MSRNERDTRSEPGEGQEPADEIAAGYLGVSPPVERLPEFGGQGGHGTRAWVDRPEQLAMAADALRQAQVIAIDAEFAQIRSHAQGTAASSGPRLALLQLAIEGQCFVVDALRVHDLSLLASVVGNPAISILLHGAGADMRVMSERGLVVAHYYDLEAASRSIFGQRESSLAAMLLRAFNVRLDKSLQRTDWTRRPLPSAMIAYAARDAEMTLALYNWLQRHYATFLRLHDSVNLEAPVAAWIEPHLRVHSPMSPDVALAEAILAGTVASPEQALRECAAALAGLVHPMLRSRLLRLITDLNFTAMAPAIEPILQASTFDERAAAVRALSRLDGERYKDAILPLLQDPVFDVRKAAHIALRVTEPKEPKIQRAAPVRRADGSRSWTVGGNAETQDGDEGDGGADDWKARLRSIMGE